MTPPIRCDRIRCAYSASFYTGEFLILYRSRFQFSLKGVWSLIMHRRPTLFPGSRGTLMAIRGDLGNNLLRSASLSTSSLQSSLIFRLKVSILSLYVRTSIGVFPELADQFPVSLGVGLGSAPRGTLSDSSGSELPDLP